MLGKKTSKKRKHSEDSDSDSFSGSGSGDQEKPHPPKGKKPRPAPPIPHPQPPLLYASGNQTPDQAVKALQALRDSYTGQPHAVSPSELSGVISAMRQHESVAFVQEAAASALCSITFLEQNCLRLVDAGGVDQLLRGMRAHRGNVVVQHNGCGVLMNMASSATSWTKTTKAVRGAQIIADVLEASSAHPAVVGVLTNVCGFLQSVTVAEDMRDHVITLGGIRALLEASKTHSQSDAVTGAALSALYNITTDNEKAALEISKQGGIQVTLQVMKTHIGNSLIQEPAVGLLWHLGYTEDKTTMDLLCTKICVQQILEAMSLNRDNAYLQEGALGALVQITQTSIDCIKLDFARKVVDEIIITMRAHPKVPAVQINACGALCNIASFDENTSLICNRGGLDSILSAMRVHPDQQYVQENGCGALVALTAFSTTLLEQAKEKGAIAIATAAAAKFPSVGIFGQALDCLKRAAHPGALKALEVGCCSAAVVPRCKSDDCLARKRKCCYKCSVSQSFVHCFTCHGSQADTAAYCSVCATRCHTGHDLSPLFFDIASCDCQNDQCHYPDKHHGLYSRSKRFSIKSEELSDGPLPVITVAPVITTGQLNCASVVLSNHQITSCVPYLTQAIEHSMATINRREASACGLTSDEQFAIALFCYDVQLNGGKYKANFHYQLNRALLNSSQPDGWTGYLNFLRNGLHKLPKVAGVAYQAGSRADTQLPTKLSIVTEIKRHCFSSATRSRDVAEQFAAHGGVGGTLLVLHFHNAKSLELFATVPGLSEVVLPPGATFSVTTSPHSGVFAQIDLTEKLGTVVW